MGGARVMWVAGVLVAVTSVEADGIANHLLHNFPAVAARFDVAIQGVHDAVHPIRSTEALRPVNLVQIVEDV